MEISTKELASQLKEIYENCTSIVYASENRMIEQSLVDFDPPIRSAFDQLIHNIQYAYWSHCDQLDWSSRNLDFMFAEYVRACRLIASCKSPCMDERNRTVHPLILPVISEFCICPLPVWSTQERQLSQFKPNSVNQYVEAIPGLLRGCLGFVTSKCSQCDCTTTICYMYGMRWGQTRVERNRFFCFRSLDRLAEVFCSRLTEALNLETSVAYYQALGKGAIQPVYDVLTFVSLCR